MPQTEQFKKLLRSTKETYLGKPVPVKFQKEHGKVYQLSETKSIAHAIAKKKNIKID